MVPPPASQRPPDRRSLPTDPAPADVTAAACVPVAAACARAGRWERLSAGLGAFALAERRSTCTLPHTTRPVIVIRGAPGVPGSLVVVVEAAYDPGAADINIGVFGDHDGDVADDRGGVDSRLAVDEPGLAEVDLAAADHRQPPEGAAHHPPARAPESGNDPGIPDRGGCRACQVAWLWSRHPQVLQDGGQFSAGPGSVGCAQPLLEFRHRQPALPRTPLAARQRPGRGRRRTPDGRYVRAILRPHGLGRISHPTELMVQTACAPARLGTRPGSSPWPGAQILLRPGPTTPATPPGSMAATVRVGRGAHSQQDAPVSATSCGPEQGIPARALWPGPPLSGARRPE